MRQLFNKAIRLLLLTNGFILLAGAMLGPIYALFVERVGGDLLHASLAGVYLSAAVHFAAIYQQTPVGLPIPPEIGKPVGRLLQCAAWEAIVRDPHSGVRGTAKC